MTLRLNGSSSGYTEIDAPAVAGNNNLKLPGGNGSDGNILGTDGAGNLSWVNGRMVLETAKASTSGTFVDFTGIPSWVKRVTVMFNGVSTNGTSVIQVRLGTSAGIQSTGYNSYSFAVTSPTTVTYATSTTGVNVTGSTAAGTRLGNIVFSLYGNNDWTATGVTTTTDGPSTACTNSTVSLSGTLTQLRITTVNGTDTFDAGSINILYEG